MSASEDLARRVGELEWYHTLELPGGVVTPGFFDHRGILSRYGLPADLTGKRVLDVGTFDGFFAFELERRGAAEVIGLDVPDAESLDWPAPMRDQDIATRFQPRHANFDVAKQALGSRAERVFVSVYDVDRADLGTFDLVFVGSLLVHLRDPVRALMSLARVCTGVVHLAEPTHRGLNLVGRWLPAAKFQALSPHMTWWIPNRRCLAQWLAAAGFEGVRVRSSFTVPFRTLRGGVYHTVVTARAPSPRP